MRPSFPRGCDWLHVLGAGNGVVGIKRSVGLGSVITLGTVTLSEFVPSRYVKIPRQERLDLRRTWPPAAAQCSKYQLSHLRGLSFHTDNVAKIENNAAVSWPLQSEPEPEKFFRATAGPRARRSEALLSIGIRASSTSRVSPSQCSRKLSNAFRQGVARSAWASPVSTRVLDLGHRLTQAHARFSERRGILRDRQSAVIEPVTARESVAAIPGPTSSTPASPYPPG